MAQLTITANASGTLDGNAFSQSGTFVAMFDELSEQTMNIDNVMNAVNECGTGYGFIFIANIGSDDAVIELGIGASFVQLNLLIGAHIVLPGTLDNAGTNVIITNINGRSVGSGGTRLMVIAGRKMV